MTILRGPRPKSERVQRDATTAEKNFGISGAKMPKSFEKSRAARARKTTKPVQYQGSASDDEKVKTLPK